METALADSGMSYQHRFRDVRDKSDLPPAQKRLRQRSKPTLKAMSGPWCS